MCACGVAVDATGNLYIADQFSARIRKISAGVITTVAGNGTAGLGGDNGPATSAQLYSPEGVAVDSAGNLYIADANNHRTREVSGGVITSVAGGGLSVLGDPVPAASASLYSRLASPRTLPAIFTSPIPATAASARFRAG